VIDKWLKQKKGNTHPENSWIVMYASPRGRLVHSEVLHLRCTEYDILVRFLNRGDELGLWSTMTRQQISTFGDSKR
jgi:hypothetical protein